MHVLVFRHVPFEDIGLIAPALEARSLRLAYSDAYGAPGPQPDWRSAAGLLFMGGPMSANDDLPFIRQEIAIIQEAVASGMPVLGVCLGAQLLARALGARVCPNATKEIGWAPVHWTEAAASDCLFAGLASPEMLFHWHGETFDLPGGSEWLAWSQACRHQAFRIGASAYGLQFHLEVTPGMIADWCREDANAGDLNEVSAPIDPFAHSQRLAALAATVFGRWAGLVAERHAARP
jgi:GMP synthase-like glutamine amidotransferase